MWCLVCPLCCCEQVLIVYYGWVKLITNLPISWMPNITDMVKQLRGHAVNHNTTMAAVTATATAAASQPTAWQSVKWAATVAFGGPVSLDCLFQSWGMWQGSNGAEGERLLATAVIMRTFIRWVALASHCSAAALS